MSSKFKTPDLRGNVVALGIFQASNYLIPLILLPYLTRVLGAEAFGKVIFAQALMAYMLLIIDYGFSWSATREISVARNNPKELSRIFMSTWMAQWLLFAMVGVALILLLLFVERLRLDAPLYAAAMLSVLGGLLLPLWFFQGLEHFKAVAVFQILIRFLAIVPIFVFVTVPEHAVRVLLAQGCMSVIGGLAALYWIKNHRLVDWHIPEAKDIRSSLNRGASLFGSRLSISFYTNLIPLVLGWVAGPVALAFFSVADKLRVAGQSLMGPLSQALYPRISHLVNEDKQAAFALIKTSALVTLILAGSASAILWLLADVLIILIAGDSFKQAVEILRWLAALPLIIGFSNLLGVQIMLAKSMSKPFNTILGVAAGLSVVLVWPLSYLFAGVGAAATLLIVEFFVTLCMSAYLWKKGYLANHLWRNE